MHQQELYNALAHICRGCVERYSQIPVCEINEVVRY